MRQVLSRLATVAILARSCPQLAHAQAWPTTSSRVERGLSSPDVAVRREAAGHLGELPPSRVRHVLPRVLEDLDPAVRVAAGRAAIRVGADATARAEVWLSDAEPAVRQVAAQMLGVRVPPPSAVTALARTLSDPVAAVRLEAARALANAPAEDGARVLLNHLNDTHEAFVLVVVDALATLRSPTAVVPLVGKVSDPRVNVRRAVVRALGEFSGASQVTMPLVLALADSDPEVRRVAIESIVAARAFDAAPALEERVRRDRDVDVQAAALGGLLLLAEQAPEGPMRTRVAELATECLDHERQELRSESLSGLSAHPRVARRELRNCLATATGEVVGPCALALAHDRDPASAELFVAAWRQGRILAPDLLTALGIQGGDQSLLLVLELLATDAPGIRTRAIEVAGDLLNARGGDGRAVEPVADALREARAPSEVEALVELLGKTRSLRAVGHLLQFLDEQDVASVRIAAVRALGEIPGAEVPVELVEKLLTNEDSALRAATTLALREGEWKAATGLLLRLLEAAKLDESESLAVALWGPASHLHEPKDVARLVRLVEQADERTRDALIEALARVEWALAEPAWNHLAQTRACAPLAKVAEVLAAHTEAVPLLVSLTSSACAPVVANAVWALGEHADMTVADRLRPLIGHRERAVAGNAVATLARIATRERKGAVIAAVLCEQVHLATLGPNAARAANALFGLRSIGQRCNDGLDERNLLATATAPRVRMQAAWLLQTVSAAPEVERKLLQRCVRTDLDGEVAAACVPPNAEKATAPSDAGAARPTTIMVVPAGRAKPAPAVPFTLVTEYGAYRFGWTDARGAVWQQTADSEAVSLGLPVGQW